MARARNIKPSFFKNELIGTADPLLGLLFISLWTLADKQGRLEDRPLRIKAETFPYRENIDVNGYLTQLQRFELIDRYVVDGLAIIQIVKFAEHQSPHSTEKNSTLPAKPMNSTVTVNPPLNNESTNVNLNINVLNPECGIMNPDLLNHEPLKPKNTTPSAVAVAPKFDFAKSLSDAGVPEKHIASWLKVRKAKRGVNTEEAYAGFVREATAAGLTIPDAVLICVERSWAGIKADWLQSKAQAATVNSNSPLGKHGQATAENARRWLESQNESERAAT